MRVRSAIPLAPLTTLRLGGPARRMAELEREEDVVDAVREADASGEPLFVLGGGSNVVVGDEGFAGLVVRMAIRGVVVHDRAAAVVVEASAGEPWDPFVERAVQEGWTGVACLSAIPGLVGATPIQNVGAYGEEVRESITCVRAYDRVYRTFVDLDAQDCRFGYRASVFKRSERWIVTRVRFVFERAGDSVLRHAELARTLSTAQGSRAPLGLVREGIFVLRRAKGMVVDPGDPDSVSAGSFFVNPAVDAETVERIAAGAGTRPPVFDAGPGRYKVAAAWLVERAGFGKGWGKGRAGVSRKHALALVNRGGATTRELLAVARAIHDGVRQRFGVALELEPVLVGCSWDDARRRSGQEGDL